MDPFFGNLNDPLSLHKYLYTQGDPANGADPTGLWTVGGLVTGITIGLTLGSLALPALGVAYLSATGKLSLDGVIRAMGDERTWASAVGGIAAGTAMSVGVQKFLLLFGKQAAKRMTPGLGLLFAAYGFWESVKLTYRLVTEELPREDAERYVATLLVGSTLTVLLGAGIKYMAKKGVENDAAYWNMTADDQRLYNIGQQMVPTRVWRRLGLEGLSPVDKGRTLVSEFGSCRRTIYSALGMLEATSVNLLLPGRLTAFKWLDTGLTPLMRFMLVENGLMTINSIIGSEHLATQVIDDLFPG